MHTLTPLLLARVRMMLALVACVGGGIFSENLWAQDGGRPGRGGGFVVPGSSGSAGPLDGVAKLRDIATQYYDMHTDVPDDLAREAALRLDRMFEEYTLRTADFAKPFKRRLPFYLFTREEDYFAAGGIKGSAGVFMVRGEDARLMGTVIPHGGTWHVVQHEGFHQFAYFAISPKLPMWVNEGLAEYFGEARFTGDGMVSGLIPEGRRRRVVEMIKRGKHHSFAEMLTISNQQWAKEMDISNYDQAWSMVHFMAQADGGRYQRALLAYMSALSNGVAEEKAWTDAVGAGATADFQNAWKRYWLALKVNATEALYSQARMMTLTSFLARSRATGQRWGSAREFVVAAREGEVKGSTDAKLWLPPGLLTEALEEAGEDATLKLEWSGQVPRLSRQYPDGSTTVVTFAMQGGKPRTVAESVGPARRR